MITRRTAAKMTYRLGFCSTLGEVDTSRLVAGIDESGEALALLSESRQRGDEVPTFCALLWALTMRDGDGS